LFKDSRVVLLNHKPEAAKPHKEHKPHGLVVIPNKHAHGEDDPIFSQRLERDGWTLKSPWHIENRGYPKLFHTIQPEVREKANPDGSQVIRLTRSIEGLDYSEEFAVRSLKQPHTMEMDRASWAEWDQHGRLVFARDGKILVGMIKDDGRLAADELVDLNSGKPTAIRAPQWATKW